jgi:hypothetical protein
MLLVLLLGAALDWQLLLLLLLLMACGILMPWGSCLTSRTRPMLLRLLVLLLQLGPAAGSLLQQLLKAGLRGLLARGCGSARRPAAAGAASARAVGIAVRVAHRA